MKQEAVEIESVLPALSDHLDATAEASMELLHAATVPFSSVYHGRFKDIDMAHFVAIGEEVDCTVEFDACNLP